MRLIDADVLMEEVNIEIRDYMLTEKGICSLIRNAPTIDAVEVDGYTEWLEKLIVDLESFEWICEDTPCPEWCEENCNYSSIQAECLRHLYEASKGGDSE